jgi:hypothetical protein
VLFGGGNERSHLVERPRLGHVERLAQDDRPAGAEVVEAGGHGSAAAGGGGHREARQCSTT